MGVAMGQQSVQWLSSHFAWAVLAITVLAASIIYIKYMLATSSVLYVKSFAMMLATEFATVSSAPSGTVMYVPTSYKYLPGTTHVYIVESKNYRVLVINSTYKTVLGKEKQYVVTFPLVSVVATHFDPESGQYFVALNSEVDGNSVCVHSPYSNYAICGGQIGDSVYNKKLIHLVNNTILDPVWKIDIPIGYVKIKKENGVIVILDGSGKL